MCAPCNSTHSELSSAKLINRVSFVLIFWIIAENLKDGGVSLMSDLSSPNMYLDLFTYITDVSTGCLTV